MAKVLVVLSGCGVYDGAEIHESVVTLLALDRQGAQVIMAAPNMEQAHVIDHGKGAEAQGEGRNVLTESARIARGPVVDLAQVRAGDYDALIFPGGFGAAKNLCTYAFDGLGLTVNPEVERVIGEFQGAGKPVGAWCIAPVLVAKVLGARGVRATLTIGDDPTTAEHIASLGCVHKSCAATEAVVDREHRVVSCPAYMTGQSIGEVAAGIEKGVRGLLALL